MAQLPQSLDLTSHAGRRFVITGALGGLGWEMTLALAQAGAEVTMAVRRPEAARTLANQAGLSVNVVELDLACLASVHRCAEQIVTADVLINNAGVMGLPFGRTADGFENQLGINHLGHFALTNLLLPRLTDRVVVVGSAAHLLGRARLEDLDYRERKYRRFGAYAGSKLANLLFLLELERRLRASGSLLKAVGAHPGYTSTGIVAQTDVRAFDLLSTLGNRLVAMTPTQGAAPILQAATATLAGNSYLGPRGLAGLRGRPGPARRSRRALDADAAQALWTLSERLTGVTGVGSAGGE